MPQSLPEALKNALRPTKQWLAISDAEPQALVDVLLVGGAHEFVVTIDSAVAALRPLTLRVGLEPELQAAISAVRTPQLRLVERGSGRTTGVLQLKHLRDWNPAQAAMALFEVVSGRHYCAHALRRAWDSWNYRRAVRHSRPEDLLMIPRAVEQLMIFYHCPRPVFFVSVDDGEHSNLFPMDLVGPLQPDRFTLALRNTSPSVETMKRTRRIALGDVPGDACQIAYQLGTHHKKLAIDWSELPFMTRRSKEFALRVPDIALRVREIEILDFQTIGSHTLFVGRIRTDEPLQAGPRLFHTSGVYQRLRVRDGRPFTEASRAAVRAR
jgi:flavin reductase (DIM6/NTAB) family NADH-FMN oxidoreductase RutF